MLAVAFPVYLIWKGELAAYLALMTSGSGGVATPPTTAGTPSLATVPASAVGPGGQINVTSPTVLMPTLPP